MTKLSIRHFADLATSLTSRADEKSKAVLSKRKQVQCLIRADDVLVSGCATSSLIRPLGSLLVCLMLASQANGIQRVIHVLTENEKTRIAGVVSVRKTVRELESSILTLDSLGSVKDEMVSFGCVPRTREPYMSRYRESSGVRRWIDALCSKI